MCGLVGVVGTTGGGAHDRVRIACDAMRHRGPDADGLWQDDAVTLGHRRLKIIDLSSRSDQPIVDHSGRYVLTYNGEVYNFSELSTAAGGDTIALLTGPPFATRPESLRGMFAYGLWDRADSSLLLVRDRFGMKPMYVDDAGGEIIFASTASAVSSVRCSHEVDPIGISTYLRSGSVQGPGTIYTGVRELEPGSTLEWRGGRSIQSKYWTFEEARSERQTKDLGATLLDSVTLHGVSDVPIALFLSGGVDSAIIGALAKKAGLSVTAFTLAFPGSDIDEAEDAALTARALGLPHQIVDYSGDSPDFEGYFSASDQPSIDGMNTYLISAAAAEAGFRVAMSGIGADELFAGYNSFRRVPALAAFNGIPSDAFRRSALARSNGNHGKALELVNAGCNFGRVYDELRSVFTREEAERLSGVPVPIVDYGPSFRTPADAVTELEVKYYLRNTLLRDADVFSMAHSLEIRTPFVDHHVLSAALSISNGRRMVYRKKLLRDAVGSPRVAEVLRKPKRGFRLPLDRWLRGPLQDRVDELGRGPLGGSCELSEIRRHVDEWRRGADGGNYVKVWALLVLDAWLRNRENLNRKVGTCR
jgi:asparagine synthase (glutamine-hydrolysing)